MSVRLPMTCLRLLSVALLLGAQEAKTPVTVDEKAGTISFGAVTLKLETEPQVKGVIEYVIVNKGGKAYESLFVANIDALALDAGLKKIGLAPGVPAQDDGNGKISLPTGAEVRISVEWKAGETAKREPVESFILDTQTGKAMEPVGWLFTGSKKGFVPEIEDTSLLVLTSKHLVGLLHRDATVLLTNPVVNKTEHRYKGNKATLPKEGTPVRIIFEAKK